MHDGLNAEWKVMYGTYGLMPDRYSAFTVAELGEMLPVYINYEGRPLEYYCYTTDEEWVCDEHNQPTILSQPRLYYAKYLRMQPEPKSIEVSDQTEANARAKMLIHLIENKLITLEKKDE